MAELYFQCGQLMGLIDVGSPQLSATGYAKAAAELWAHTFPGAAPHSGQAL